MKLRGNTGLHFVVSCCPGMMLPALWHSMQH